MYGTKNRIINAYKNHTLFKSLVTFPFRKIYNGFTKFKWKHYSIGFKRVTCMKMQIKNVELTKRYRKKYINDISNFKTIIDNTYSGLPHEKKKIIWVCWLQGLNNAPGIVKACIRSIQRNIDNSYRVVIITEKNYLEYCSPSKHVIDAYHKGIMLAAHFSDMLRLELLKKHGGTWIDSTILVTGRIPNYMLQSDLFMPQTLHWERFQVPYTIENYFMSSCQNNKIIMLALDLLNNYWEKAKKPSPYMITYMFLEISIEQYSDEWKNVVLFPRANMHLIYDRLYEEFDNDLFKKFMQISPVHKLTYRKEYLGKKYCEHCEKGKSFYDYIINNY